MKTGSLSNPLCASLSPLTQQPPTSSPSVTWSHGPRISGSASSCHVEPIPDEPPRICCRPRLQGPRRQITVACKTGKMSEERENHVCSFTAPLLICLLNVQTVSFQHKQLLLKHYFTFFCIFLLLVHHLNDINIKINHILTLLSP